MEQYSIVIIPTATVSEYVEKIAMAIAVRFKVEPAERPFKITLVNPFHCGEDQIQQLSAKLAEIIGKYDKMQTSINGYSTKQESGSVFLMLSETDEIIHLQKVLLGVLKTSAPNLKPIIIRDYEPMICLVRNEFTRERAELFKKENEELTLAILWEIGVITIMKRENGQWTPYKEMPLNSGMFTRTIRTDNDTYTYTFEPVDDNMLNELYYIVSTQGSEPFIMRYDDDALQFKVEGPAPYEARMFENELSAFIENYNE